MYLSTGIYFDFYTSVNIHVYAHLHLPTKKADMDSQCQILLKIIINLSLIDNFGRKNITEGKALDLCIT